MAHPELHDPETDPLATYVLEPDDLRSLTDRLVVGPGSATHIPVAPFTGAPIAAIPLSTPADVARAARKARAAQRLWAARPVRERAAVLLRLHDLLLERQSDVLDLVQIETGKARAHAFEEVVDVANVARHYGLRAAGYLAERRVLGVIPGLTAARVLRHPLGVVGLIAPWNMPFNLVLGDALPALVAGNAVLLRPDRQTTLTALWAAELLDDAGLPPDVLQVVSGDRTVGAAVVEHADAVIFTGSSRGGRAVAAQAGARLIPTTLELGGKNGVYVADDVDVEVAAKGLVRTCFGSAGQVCVSAERVYVHEAVYDELVDAFVERTEALRLGSGLDYRSDMGSLASAEQLARVVEHVEDAVGHGAQVLAGGEQRPDLGPYFYAPTILAEVPPEARCSREETFGPVVAIYPVASDDEAVAAVNDTEYGLSAGVWTSDERRGWALARRLRAGSVAVNEAYVLPWGSVAGPQAGWGSSGLGARHGREAVLAATRPQTIAMEHLAHGLVGRGGPSLGLDRLFFDHGGDVWTRLYTAALAGMRALRLP